jgi:sarcosine oxidase subunit delta
MDAASSAILAPTSPEGAEMKILHCPLNGPRNISEFMCLGEVKPVPPPDAGVAQWADFVFMERNAAGWVREWWLHIATNFVFLVDRDTRIDEILATYRIGDTRLQHSPGEGSAS